MGDLIDRQAALDAINAIIHTDRLFPSRPKVYMARDAIKDLPSAVPDTVKDLVTIFQNSKDMKLIARDGDLRADRIVLGRMPFEWVPVSERLPDIDVPVIVTDYAGGMKEIEVDRCGQYDDSDERYWWNSQNPIAWMPLPEPYEEDTNGKT